MTVYVLCDGGFGNRFNALVSGLHLAQLLYEDPVILWNSNNWCGASWQDLFANDWNIQQFVPYDFFATHNSLNLIHENQFQVPLVSHHPNHVDLAVIQQLRPGHDSVFYFYSLLPDWMDQQVLKRDVVQHLRFQPSILEQAREQIQLLGGRDQYWGLHIRKTDMPQGNEDAWHQFVQQHSADRIFVCSDSELTEQEFAVYKNVKSYPKTSFVEKLVPGDWNSLIRDGNGNIWPFNVNRSASSVQQALVDLLVLSQSRIVETNMCSTFLRVAQMLHDVPVAGLTD